MLQKFWHPWSKFIVTQTVKQVEMKRSSQSVKFNLKHSLGYFKQYQCVIFVLTNFKEERKESSTLQKNVNFLDLANAIGSASRDLL